MPANGISPVDRITTEIAYRSTQPVEREEATGITSVLSAVANKPVNAPDARVQAIQKQDVRMRFLIDPTSKQVTVLIFDKASQKVLRTIPADELSKMQEGDLVNLIS
jgi:uncharacterized FlaG/YvyC family protein